MSAIDHANLLSFLENICENFIIRLTKICKVHKSCRLSSRFKHMDNEIFVPFGMNLWILLNYWHSLCIKGMNQTMLKEWFTQIKEKDSANLSNNIGRFSQIFQQWQLRWRQDYTLQITVTVYFLVN